ncbi:AraC family transcriptional regulator [Bacillus sp. FSL K6-3431]|uniref:AraC family transcriptional regulator n=1 Tax=Bacillus sp. FSL K6-3431 TaxID=2921500 RepID=UPI0030FAF270
MKEMEKIIDVGMFSLLRPTINFANKMTAGSDQAWGPRTIADCQLVYIVSGVATLTLGKDVIILHAGECVFYGSNSPHRLVASKNEPFTFMSIHFDWNTDHPYGTHPFHGIKNCSNADLNTAIPRYKLFVDDHGEVIFPHHFIMPNMESLFAQIVREYRFEEHGFPFILRGLFTQLLTFIIRHEINGSYLLGERRKIVPALEAIRKQPAINWSLSELADVCGYHPTYFSSIFKEITGFPPKQYLILERIRKAKQLLLEAKRVEDVALTLGYTSIHYFCRNFKSITGLTPTEYKLQSLEL